MASTKSAFSVRFFGLFALFSFIAGFMLVLAAQRNTERRSQASTGPYVCTAACSPEAGGVGGAACLACMQSVGAPKVGDVCNADYTTNASNDCENCPGGKWYVNPTTNQPNCGTAPVVPTPSISPWDQCMSWDTTNNDACVDTYRTYKEKRDSDWRCKPAFSYLGLCNYPPVEYPSEPME
ncbi:hypothetical protein HZB58_03645 [Candidatus Gottesmanbacteria bacterium]|nr:hypothetical protein [Candidatus Gottesmanbacteria bacterium]